MRPSPSTAGLLLSLLVAWPAAAAEPEVVDLWPGNPPDESGGIGPERIVMSPALDRKQVEVTEPTRMITDVARPTLTIYRPSKEKAVRTAMLICPGGGYWNLYWQLEGEEVAAWLNSIGVTGIVLKYRVPRRPDEPKGEPARRPLQDAQRAVSLVRSRAGEWGIDPRRIGIIGFSAGGHLAIATATGFDRRTHEPIDEVDRTSPRPDFAVLAYPGYLKAKDKDELAPGICVPADTPPVFLAHGGDDIISPPQHSVLMYLALKAAGVPAELHVYATAAHDFGVRPSGHPCSTWTQSCAAWLRRQGLLGAAPTSGGDAAATGAAEAPDFGPSVLIFDPSMGDIQGRIDAVFGKQERAQFGPDRYALLFKPGKYDLEVQVGFYTQVLGLGRSPGDVAIAGAVRSTARWMRGNATCNFWRAVENLSVTPTRDGGVDMWAVSQATALRRVHVKGSLNLWDDGWSSGGFIADSKVDGQVNSGSQQQWLSRNAEWGSWKGGNWNMVFVGTVRPPVGTWPAAPYTVIEKTPLIREKPYLFIDEGGRYSVMVPSLQRGGTQGTTWSAGSTPGMAIPIERFHLAHPDRDRAGSLNAALEGGKHLLFTPGIYLLEGAIRVARPGTIVLGLGYPTLRPEEGTEALEIADVGGVEVGGILIEAGAVNSRTLLRVGEPGREISHAADPVFLFDIFCRAGGAGEGSASCFVTIDSSDVVGDNLWLWRADHGKGVGWTRNRNETGLIVNGDDVTIYGLFVEHGQGYQTVWNGDGGRVYFYQSEMPYDPPSQDAWRHGEVDGYASYKVGDAVTTHEAWGLGVYCVFKDAPVVAENAFETPAAPGVKLHHMVTIRLSGKSGSGIRHVINGTGDPVITTRKAIVD